MRPHHTLLTRDDTFLGICEGLGQDFGFNPLWLRLAFAAALLFGPVAVIGTYLGLGAIVAFTHALFPMARRQAASPASEGPTAIAADPRNRADARQDFAIAA